VFSVHCAVVRGYPSSRAIAVDRGMNNPASHYLISGSHASANPSSSHRPIKWGPLFTRYTDSESVREKKSTRAGMTCMHACAIPMKNQSVVVKCQFHSMPMDDSCKPQTFHLTSHSHIKGAQYPMAQTVLAVQ
jgi:hypothetical protein